MATQNGRPQAPKRQGVRPPRQVRLFQAGGFSQAQRDRISALLIEDFPTEAAGLRTLLFSYLEFPDVRDLVTRRRPELSARIGRRLVDRGAIVPVEER